MTDALILGNVRVFAGLFTIITGLYFFYGIFLIADTEDEPLSKKQGIWATVGFLVTIIITANLYLIEDVLSR